MSDWKIFQGTPDNPHDGIDHLPDPPPWRDFATRKESQGRTFRASPREIELVNAALYLRRPLLVTGPTGTGKSSLAHAVAAELQLGDVLRWSISSRSTLKDGLYSYDALARLQDENLRSKGGAAGPDDIGRYLRLGPLGNAFLPDSKPRVLLIDEIDKSDVDLPNDLLHVFEEGNFEIDELMRIAAEHPRVEVLSENRKGELVKIAIDRGKVHCQAFPFVILTSNDERELPPAFQRRCLRLQIAVPKQEELEKILHAHLEGLDLGPVQPLLVEFLNRRDDQGKMLATDQLLNAVFLLTRGTVPPELEKRAILDVLFRELGRS